MNTNVVVLTGRCTKAAELKYAANGFAICSFTVAVNERIKKKGTENEFENRPNFFDIVVFGNYGKAMQPYLTRGREVTISGRLKQERWSDENGHQHSRVNIVADNVEPQRTPNGNSGNYQSVPEPAPEAPSAPAAAEAEDEIPFE